MFNEFICVGVVSSNSNIADPVLLSKWIKDFDEEQPSILDDFLASDSRNSVKTIIELD